MLSALICSYYCPIIALAVVKREPFPGGNALPHGKSTEKKDLK